MQTVLDALFTPIARLLVARGVLFAQAAERLKAAYVRAAMRAPGAKTTDSRISVLTGLQRRDVARLRDDTPGPRAVNHLARLVAQWQIDPAYAGRDLPRKGAVGSFDALALSIRRDVHPRTLLEQLLQAGTVSEQPDGALRLEQSSYQPLPGSAAQTDYLAQNAGDFLTASVDNVLGASPPEFERAVHYNGLSPEAVAELDAEFRDGQMALMHRLSARAAQLQDASPGPLRFRAGGYFHSSEEDPCAD